MARKFKRKVKDFPEASFDMEMLDDYLVQLDQLIQSIDWNALFVAFPAPGGGLPPPSVPKWPP